MSQLSLPCSLRPTLMQANTSTCQPGGFLSLWTEGPLGLPAATSLQTRARVEVKTWCPLCLSFSPSPAPTRDRWVFRNPKA